MPSFVEHVQIEELAKGRIIDAVARDVGPSVYVDILVANELKHKDLIRDIKSGKLNTLSMGCTIDGSTCSYCGNWAADETEMCEHIRFQKSNRFYDETGKQRIIAELCGDESLDPTGGVTFIEASWVEVPAFKGAVARNIVQLTEGDSRTAREVQRVYSLPVPTARPLGRPVAASLLRGAGEEFYDGEVPAEGEAPAEAPAAAPANPFADLEEDLRNQLVDRVRTRLKDELGRDQLQRQLAPSDAPNDTIVKQAAARPYRAALRTLVATSARPQDLVARIAKLNSEMGIFVPGSVYLTALKVGAVSRAASVTEYLGRCAELLGRKPTKAEAKTLIRLGSLLAAHNKRSKQKTTP